MKCPSCNRETTGNGKFCTFCGAKLPVVKYCPTCGAVLDMDKRFCEKCGSKNESFSQTQQSYPVFSMSDENKSSNQITSQLVSGTLIKDIPASQSSESLSAIQSPVDDNFDEKTSKTYLKDSNLIDHDDSLTSTQENPEKTDNIDSVDLPVYEDIEKSTPSFRWILSLIVFIILVAGVLLLGQRFNWWNIGILSWAGGNENQTETVEASEYIVEEEPQIGIEEDQYNEEEIDASEPYTVTLNGTIGNKYPIEMVLDGEKKGDAFYPSNGKYRYTKYEGAWIYLHCVTEDVVNSSTSLRILEYTDGDLTGTWNVEYNLTDNTLTGTMTNSKQDSYSVSLGSGSGLKQGYQKIEGAVVADSNIYPFYIDFNIENESIKNAVYHNPKYDVKTDLPICKNSEEEYYFEGDMNGHTLIIRFSKNAPHKGTLNDGSNVLNIEMNL